MRHEDSSSAGASGPYIPASRSLPELTVKALLTGLVLSAVLAGANAYLGLKVGLTVSASIPAAVMSMAILRQFKNSNILENNLVQTAASAGESLAAGVIFTLPALVMLGYWLEFEFVPTMCIAFFGGSLGVMFTIPLRQALIVEADLKFPEGVATGEVLKAGEERGGGAKLILVSGIAGALLKICQTGFKAVAGSVHTSVPLGRSVFGVGSELGAALLSVGYIVGLNIAILVFAGGLISWLFGIPIYMAVADPAVIATDLANKGALEGWAAVDLAKQTMLAGAPSWPASVLAYSGVADPGAMATALFQHGPSPGYAGAQAIWSEKIRYLGVGAMATGGVWALLSLIKPIRAGIRSSVAAVRQARKGEIDERPRTERDMPIHYVGLSTLVLAAPLFVVFLYVIDRQSLGISSGLYAGTIIFGVLFALLAGFLFSSVAGYMAGLVGSSNNPISGVTIATILTISLILLVLLGNQIDFAVDAEKAKAAAATAIMVGGVVCCAAAIAGDNMQDLKAGQIVGATPYKQQIMQLLGVAAAAVVLAPILQLLFNAYGLGDVFPREGMNAKEALQAPQSVLMRNVAEGVFTGGLPKVLIAIGAGLAVVIIVVDEILKKLGKNFRTPVLAVAVGIYLPVELSVPIFLGGLVAHLAGRRLRDEDPAVRARANRNGLLFASGLITGEALLGILLAVPFAAAKSADALKLPLPDGWGSASIALGAAAFVGLSVWIYRVATRIEN